MANDYIEFDPPALQVNDAIFQGETVKLRLKRAPAGGQVVFHFDTDEFFTLDKCQLVFDGANWNAYQSVVVNSGSALWSSMTEITAKLKVKIQAFDDPSLHEKQDEIEIRRQITDPAVCKSVGDPHIETLDGKGYTYNGDGTYFYVKTERLWLQSEHYKCHEMGLCNGRIAFRYLNGYVFFDMNRAADGKNNPGAGVTVVNAGDMSHIKTEKLSDAQYKFTLSDGSIIEITVTEIDGTTHLSSNVFVTLVSSYKKRVTGLCGNYDGNGDNDYINDEGNLQYRVPDGENLLLCRENCPNPWKGDVYFGQKCKPDIPPPPVKTTSPPPEPPRAPSTTVEKPPHTPATMSTTPSSVPPVLVSTPQTATAIVSTTPVPEEPPSTKSIPDFYETLPVTEPPTVKTTSMGQYDPVPTTTSESTEEQEPTPTPTETCDGELPLETNGLNPHDHPSYGQATRICGEVLAHLECGRVKADFYLRGCIYDSTIMGKVDDVAKRYVNSFLTECRSLCSGLKLSSDPNDQAKAEQIESKYGLNGKKAECKNEGSPKDLGGCTCGEGFAGYDCSVDASDVKDHIPTADEVNTITGFNGQDTASDAQSIQRSLALIALAVGAILFQ